MHHITVHNASNAQYPGGSALGLGLTNPDGTCQGGMVVAIQKEQSVPMKFLGLGEPADDLQPCDAKQFAEALFSEKE